MRHLTALAITAALAGCATITSPFIHLKPDYADLPVDALREVAREIEKAVQEGNRAPEIADRGGIVVNDELIMQAVRTRAARAELLNKFLDSGYGRELRNGLVEIGGGKGYKKSTTGKERNRNALLVMSENQDRWTIYEGFVKTSNLRRKSQSAIQEVFHEVRLEYMSSGQKYEDAAGDTAIKGR